MDRIARPPRPHGLDLLLHATDVAADQLDPVEDRRRRQALPELEFLPVEVSQQVRKSGSWKLETCPGSVQQG